MFMITWSTVISTCIISIEKDMFAVKKIPVWLKNVRILNLCISYRILV
jgi:hypothetical protein